jgi:dCTP diphosphatase
VTENVRDGLGSVIQELRKFVRERDWAQFHDPKNLAMAVASEAGELLAEYRWISNAEANVWSADPQNLARVAAEVADVGIALLLFCDRTGIELVTAMRDKIEANRANYPVEASRGRHSRPADPR